MLLVFFLFLVVILGVFGSEIKKEYRQAITFNLFFDMDWTNRSTIVSYGHDIEGAWLLHEAAQVIGEKELTRKIQKAALCLVDVTLNEGTDIDGSIFYERGGELWDSDKHWLV